MYSSLLFGSAADIARVSDSVGYFRGNLSLFPLRLCCSRLAQSRRWLGILFGTATERRGYIKGCVARCILGHSSYAIFIASCSRLALSRR